MDFSRPVRIKYTFFWLVLLLLCSAGAMFLGARPPITFVLGYDSMAVWSLLDIAWIVSGIAAGYLVYEWLQHSRQVFRGNRNATYAFWFMILTGVNVGIAGILGPNLFLNIFSSSLFHYVTGALCLFAAIYLFIAWRRSGGVIFTDVRVARTESPSTDKEDMPPPTSRPSSPSNI